MQSEITIGMFILVTRQCDPSFAYYPSDGELDEINDCSARSDTTSIDITLMNLIFREGTHRDETNACCQGTILRPLSSLLFST